MIEVEIDIDVLARRYRRRAEMVQDLRPLWEQLDSAIYKDEVQLFRSEGAAAGEKWRPLNKRYARQKQKRWGSKMLINSGDLFRSLTQKGATGGIYQATAKELILGSALWYAAIVAHRRRVLIKKSSNAQRIAAKWLSELVEKE